MKLLYIGDKIVKTTNGTSQINLRNQKILESIFELPALKEFNKLGGIITAAVLFIIEISIILAAIQSISSLSFMAKVVNTIQTSVITRILYEHNIFTNIILSKII